MTKNSLSSSLCDNPGGNVITNFYQSITALCWNKVFDWIPNLHWIITANINLNLSRWNVTKTVCQSYTDTSPCEVSEYSLLDIQHHKVVCKQITLHILPNWIIFFVSNVLQNFQYFFLNFEYDDTRSTGSNTVKLFDVTDGAVNYGYFVSLHRHYDSALVPNEFAPKI